MNEAVSDGYGSGGGAHDGGAAVVVQCWAEVPAMGSFWVPGVVGCGFDVYEISYGDHQSEVEC